MSILKAIIQITSIVYSALNLYFQAKKEGWIDEGEALYNKIKGASNDEERKKLVRDLNKHNQP